MAGVAPSFLVANMLNGNSHVQGLRKVFLWPSLLESSFLPNSGTQTMLKVTVSSNDLRP